VSKKQSGLKVSRVAVIKHCPLKDQDKKEHKFGRIMKKKNKRQSK
jgi:hypothetical protein